MTNEKAVKKQEELFAKDCKLINLKYEYTGYTGQEKWAIVSELSEQELFEKYPNEVKQYIPLPNFSCHTLRHTFTTRMCEAGVR